ncbi:hypothetical protein MTR_7g059037 [Medicago truncatula]|uniref:Uncharacterized protein n=1 Tax=Medicago truncatula TaxID=3880 RepID=A0A072TZH1_MEDTR|nr:hypothetical protein MTR_7g059037 [Medicago truncatula]
MKCIAQLLQRAAICTGIKHSYSKATAVSNSKFTQLIACWNGIYNGFLVFQCLKFQFTYHICRYPNKLNR